MGFGESGGPRVKDKEENGARESDERERRADTVPLPRRLRCSGREVVLHG